jgi:Tol biopolymer transport system component
MDRINLLPKCLDQLYRSALLICIASIMAGCNWVKPVTVSSDGVLAERYSHSGTVSEDGRFVAFTSIADNLVDNDSNNGFDVFLHDNLSRTTTLITVNSAGVQGGGTSPSISGDGRYVVFLSWDSSILSINDANGAHDLFLRDTVLEETTRITDNTAGFGDTIGDHVISANGRFVAFRAAADTLVATDTNGEDDIFVYDSDSGVTTRVSVDSAGSEADGPSDDPTISADGRYVAFSSYASNLASGDTNGAKDVYLHDRDTGITTRVSVVDDESELQGIHSTFPAISANGRYITFQSEAGGCLPGPTCNSTPGGQLGVGNVNHVFVRDTVTGTTVLVSADSSGTEGSSLSYNPAISGDGRYVAFVSTASNLVAGDTNGERDVFVRDTLIGATWRVSEGAQGEQSLGGTSDQPDISGDGRYVVFTTWATNVFPGDTNGTQRDVVIRAVPEMSIASVVPNMLPIDTTTAVTVTGSGFLPGVTVGSPAVESNVIVVDENTITLDITVPQDATAGAINVMVLLLGTGAGAGTGVSASCIGCVTYF